MADSPYTTAWRILEEAADLPPDLRRQVSRLILMGLKAPPLPAHTAGNVIPFPPRPK